MIITRRGLITGLATFLAAPAIVRAGSLMPVKAWADTQDHGAVIVSYPLSTDPDGWLMLPAGERIYTGDLVTIQGGKVYRALQRKPLNGVALMGSGNSIRYWMDAGAALRPSSQAWVPSRGLP